ncbi:MAG: hypothetical protein ACI30B_01910 [Paludibacteraceae bacterium]
MTGLQLNADYDLLVKNGRMVLGETTPQNQALILGTHKGEWKESPLLGVGLSDVVNDHDWNGWKRTITEQFEMDGQRIDRLEISEKGLTLEAKYK